MLLGIDHVVVAVPDLDAAAETLQQSVGLTVTGGGRHPAWGTENAIAWLGDSYIELITVLDRTVAEASWLGGPTIVALEAGRGFVTWAVATDGLGFDLVALRQMGAAVGEPMDGARRRPDGAVVRWRLALPVPGPVGPSAPPFLIEHDPDSAEWTPADRADRAEQRHPIGGPVRLAVLELPTEDIPATIQRLTRALGIRFRPSLSGGGARDANLGRQIVRLRPSRGHASQPAIHLFSPAGDDRVADALGCRWLVKRSG